MPIRRSQCWRGVVIPLFGGDTVWSNTAAAYLDLPLPLQRLADDLWATHAFALVDRSTKLDKSPADEPLITAMFETDHPVVRVHPETGERALVLGAYVKCSVDIPKPDGQKLFDTFESHIAAPENTVRCNCKTG